MKSYRFICNTTNGVNRFWKNLHNDRDARDLAIQMIEQNGDVRSITIIHGRRKVYGIQKS